MKHSERFMLGLAATYVTSVVVAYSFPSTPMKSSNLAHATILLGGLLAVLLLCCISLVIRIFLQSNEIRFVWIDRVLAAITAGIALAGNFEVTAVVYVLVIFVAYRFTVPEQRLDEEAFIRRDQVLGELGLDTKKAMPIFALAIIFCIAFLIVFVWTKNTI